VEKVEKDEDMFKLAKWMPHSFVSFVKDVLLERWTRGLACWKSNDCGLMFVPRD
jgi:hypothetical protein